MFTRVHLIGALAISGAFSAVGASPAASPDPHQRARDMITPSAAATAPNPPGARARIVERSAYIDPQGRAAFLMRDGRWPPGIARAETAGAAGNTAGADPQRQAKSIILGLPVDGQRQR